MVRDPTSLHKEGNCLIEREILMKNRILTATVVLSICMMSAAVFAAETGGAAIFKAKCAACHPDGGNIMNPKATLKGIKDSKKIISKIRKGGGGMTAFDAKAVSDADARLVAEYIMKTFKK